MKLLKTLVAATCITALVPTPLMAQSSTSGDTLGAQSPVELSGDVMAVKTVTDETGADRTELVKPDLIVPGDRLVFSTSYTNNSAEAVENFTVTNPLPSAVRLAPDADANLIVSVDGAKTWGVLADLTVSAEDGSQRSAVHADVTHVRWTITSIAPGEEGRLEYPAIIR